MKCNKTCKCNKCEMYEKTFITFVDNRIPGLNPEYRYQAYKCKNSAKLALEEKYLKTDKIMTSFLSGGCLDDDYYDAKNSKIAAEAIDWHKSSM